MTDGVKRCPECREALGSSYRGKLLTWECPSGHGVGVSILDAYGRLQRDEIEAIWVGAKDAPISKLPSPISGRPMAEVTFIADDDTEYGNVGADAHPVTIELDVENYFGWFSLEELASMPLDETKTSPAGPGFVGLDQLDRGEQKFDDIFDDAEDYAMGDDGEDPDTSRLGNFLSGLAWRLRR